MGDVTSLVATLGLLDFIRAGDVQEEERNFRQEEVFVPFKLSPLCQEQEIGQPMAADRSHVAIATYVS